MGLKDMLTGHGNFVIVTERGRYVASKMDKAAFTAINTGDLKVLYREERMFRVRFTVYVVRDDGKPYSYVNVATNEVLDKDKAQRMVDGAGVLYGMEMTL